MHEIPKLPPGPEWPRGGAAWKRREGKVIVRCENGHYSQLDHKIDRQGGVAPSFVCSRSGCDWHVNLKLEGWDLPQSPPMS